MKENAISERGKKKERELMKREISRGEEFHDKDVMKIKRKMENERILDKGF